MLSASVPSPVAPATPTPLIVSAPLTDTSASQAGSTLGTPSLNQSNEDSLIKTSNPNLRRVPSAQSANEVKASSLGSNSVSSASTTNYEPKEAANGQSVSDNTKSDDLKSVSDDSEEDSLDVSGLTKDAASVQVTDDEDKTEQLAPISHAEASEVSKSTQPPTSSQAPTAAAIANESGSIANPVQTVEQGSHLVESQTVIAAQDTSNPAPTHSPSGARGASVTASNAAGKSNAAVEASARQNSSTSGVEPKSADTNSVSITDDVVAPKKTDASVESPLQTLNQNQLQTNQLQSQPYSLATETSTIPASSEGLERFASASSTTASDSKGASAIAAKTNSKMSERISARPSEQTVHASSSVQTVQQGSHPIVSQSVAVTQDGSNPGLMRDSSDTRMANLTTGSTAGASSGAGELSTSKTFAALDADPAAGTTTWIHAGAQRAEAGYQDPNLGWVSVRADGSGGGIHAAVVPGSADAAQALGGHLAGLNTYLTENHTPVESLTLASPESHGASTGMEQNANQNMNQGAGQGSGQEAHSGQQSTTGMSTPVRSQTTSSEVVAPAAGQYTSGQTVRPSGGHISVMA